VLYTTCNKKRILIQHLDRNHPTVASIMRIILYHPRFPTHNTVPPELDVLPPSFYAPSTSQQFTSQTQSHPNTKSHGAPSTVYRVSTTTGIHTSQSYPANGKPSGHPNRANNGEPSSSQDTLQGADGDRATTPTQSNTLSHARQTGGRQRPGLNLNSSGWWRMLPSVPQPWIDRPPDRLWLLDTRADCAVAGEHVG
jgi:hypothetical protein